ncbi:DUF4922 domain-containing protein [uncultured Clostridium sp.]|uniref:DUF4922 domain-containing protein n=1 Tax=uncultured Clostridium sp. TaxID=59620 RepID=UPI00338F9DE2
MLHIIKQHLTLFTIIHLRQNIIKIKKLILKAIMKKEKYLYFYNGISNGVMTNMEITT